MLIAEVLQVLRVAQYNISFASAVHHSSLFKLMFPDSAIAACYKQSEVSLTPLNLMKRPPFK